MSVQIDGHRARRRVVIEVLAEFVPAPWTAAPHPLVRALDDETDAARCLSSVALAKEEEYKPGVGWETVNAATGGA